MPAARTFDLRRPFVALAPFMFEDRRFSPGDRVPWKDLGITDRKLLSMWGAYLIGNAPKRHRSGA